MQDADLGTFGVQPLQGLADRFHTPLHVSLEYNVQFFYVASGGAVNHFLQR